VVRRVAGERAEEAMRLFPAGGEEGGRQALSDMITAFEFSAPCRFLARSVSEAGGRAYLYHFTRVPPTERGRELCVCHGSEIPYVFGRLDPEEGYGEADAGLSAAMMDYWVNFARRGDPNGVRLPAWPAYSPRTDLGLELGDEIAAVAAVRREACDLAERIHLPGVTS